MNEVRRDARARQPCAGLAKIGIAAGVNAISQRHDGAAAAKLIRRRLAENFIGNFSERVIERCAVAGVHIRDCIPQNRPLVGKCRQDVDHGDRASGRLLIIKSHDRDPITGPQRTDKFIGCVTNQTEFFARRS